MLPYSELDNYKLQVELLQEKLQRSEENRKKLEHKLEHATQKKSEHEKVLRAKQRAKYQDFLVELEKRNERNRQLMKMLERVDQQTTALSARSERLRIMKMQYEMYFAKLVQTQTMRCIQETAKTAATPTTYLTTAPTPIPVLLPTTPTTNLQHQQVESTVMTPIPIKNNEHEPLTSAGSKTTTITTARGTTPTTTAIYQFDASGNLITAGTASTHIGNVAATPAAAADASDCNTITEQPTATALPALAASTQHWTLALATPTPAGMLLTNNPATALPPSMTTSLGATSYMAKTTAPTFDFMHHQQQQQFTPLGYLPRMRRLLQQKPNMSIYSDESDDLLPPMRANTKSDRHRHHQRTYMDNDNDMNTTYNNNYDYDDNNNNNNDDDNETEHGEEPIKNDKEEYRKNIGNLNRMDLPTSQLDNNKISEVQATKTPLMLRRDNEHQEKERLLPSSSMSPTSTASLLTLDKLPKTMTMTEHNDDVDDDNGNGNKDIYTAFASTPIDDRNNDVDDGSGGVGVGNVNETGDKAKVATRFDDFSKGISMIGGIDKGAFPIQRNEQEKFIPTTTSSVNNNTTTVISNDNGSFIEANLRQKIDISKPWQQPQHQQPQQQQQHMTQSWQQAKENTANSKETTSGDKDNTLKFDEMTAGFIENSAVENSVSANANNSGNGSGVGVGGSKGSNDDDTNTNTKKMSIEKIENEFYGELVNQPVNEADNGAARNAAQGLVSELVTQQQEFKENYETTADTVNYATNAVVDPNNASNVYEQSNSESYDPTYATIEGTTNAEVYSTPGSDNAANYTTQYTTDPNAQQQQDYSNLDYANYDTMQYAADGTYDPNVYPGYTYDEATGQYTPDQQYLGADGAGVYAEQAAYDQQQYDPSQTTQDYDYSGYEQTTENVVNLGYNENDPAAMAETSAAIATSAAAVAQPQTEAQFAASDIELPNSTTAPKSTPATSTQSSSNKPASILSSADKHAANEAQKKKKRVNFVDSSETDDSSSVKQAVPSGSASGTAANESDFDFSSTSDKSGAGSGGNGSVSSGIGAA